MRARSKSQRLWCIFSWSATGERSTAWQDLARFWEVVRRSSPTRHELLLCSILWPWISLKDCITCRLFYPSWFGLELSSRIR